MDLSLDEQLLASGGYDKTVIIWNMETRVQLINYTTYSPIFALKFSNDKRYLFAGLYSGELLIIDRMNSTATTLLKLHTSVSSMIIVSSNDNYIFTASDDGYVKILGIKTGFNIVRSLKHPEFLRGMFLNSDETIITLISTSYFATWRLDTGENIRTSYSSNGYGLIYYSPDGKYAVNFSSNTMKIYDSSLTTVINTIPNAHSSLSFMKFGGSCIKNINCNVSLYCECKNNFAIYAGLIKSSCGTIVTDKCKNCPDKTCCSSPLFLKNSTCVDKCPTGFWGNENTRTCEACDSNCASCSGSSTNCNSCSAPNYLISASCVNACPSPSWGVNETRTCSINCFNTNQFGDANNIRVCKNCDITCATCSAETNTTCLTCAFPRYLYQGACYSLCPIPLLGNNSTRTCDSNCLNSNEYGDILDRICKPCDSVCKTCVQTSKSCNSCNSPYYFSNEVCVAQCPQGKIVNDVTRTCDNCPNPNEYWDTVSKTCKGCDSTCASCVSGSFSSCMTCYSPKFLSGTSCVSACPSPRWGNNSTKSCEAACTNLNEYGDVSDNRICKVCDAKCATCSQTSSNCLSCSSPLYLSGTTCVNLCPSPNWGNNSTRKCESVCTKSNEFGDALDNRICKTCSENCATCTGTASNCLSCNTPYFLSSSQCVIACPSPTWGINGKCELNCTYSNYYGDPLDNRICKSCDINCITCSNSAKNCTSCSSQKYFSNFSCLTACIEPYWGNNSTGKCELNCNINEYGDVYYNRVCKTCSSNCKTCISLAQTCTSCSTPYYLSSSTCVSYCPSGKWPNDKAKTCDSSCPSPLWGISTGKCEASCEKINEYGDEYRVCKPCDSNCATCEKLSSNCLTCKSPRFLSNSICVLACPEPLWGNNSTRKCENSCTNFDEYGDISDSRICKSCSYYCETCKSTATTCTSCTGTYYLSNNDCVSQCQSGEWSTSGNGTKRICQKCHSSCLTCSSGDENSCLSCASPLFLNGTNCISKCESPFWGNIRSGKCAINCTNQFQYGDIESRTCKDCDPSCNTCIESPNNCLSCPYLQFFNDSKCVSKCVYPLFAYYANYTCLKTCPDEYYEDSDYSNNRKCSACYKTCLTCLDYDQNSCLSCIKPLYFFQGSCYISCPLNTTENREKRVCESASASSYVENVQNSEKTGLTAGVLVGVGLSVILIIIIITLLCLLYKKKFIIITNRFPYQTPANVPTQVNIPMNETTKNN